MAFSQLLIAGLALATRFEESREVRTVIKEVPKWVTVRVPAPSAGPGAEAGQRPAPVVSRPPVVAQLPAVEPSVLPSPTPLAVPAVADPRSERLLREARVARVAGDMMLAILKLEEALSESPHDASLHYELGMVHELMGVFDTAAAHYEKVFQMGVSGAGALYEKAAAKIRDGFAQPDALLGKLSLGRVRKFEDPGHEAGKQVILSIPVQKAPGEEIDVGEISVSVVLFNRTSRGEIVQLQPDEQSWASERWVSEPCDWAEGEETLRLNYVIPKQDEQTAHLFGEKSYYGQVVSLLYGEQVLDVQAWPPALVAKIPQAGPGGAGGDAQFPDFPEFQDGPPMDFDPNLGVLPPLPNE
ncbi:MAG: hypothetical protein RLZZ245_1368 [Verrucomicrobiota bacterium]